MYTKSSDCVCGSYHYIALFESIMWQLYKAQPAPLDQFYTKFLCNSEIYNFAITTTSVLSKYWTQRCVTILYKVLGLTLCYHSIQSIGPNVVLPFYKIVTYIFTWTATHAPHSVFLIPRKRVNINKYKKACYTYPF